MRLVTADWHLSDNPRDEYRHKWQEKLRALIKEHKVEELVVLGDLTEEKDRHRSALVNRVVGYLYEASRLCAVTVLKGNHDYVDPSTPFYGFAGYIEGLTWISVPTDAHDDLYLPHSHGDADWRRPDLDEFDFIFAHHSFEGVDAGHGYKTEGGVDFALIAGLKHAQVISGDIHVPQRRGPLTYVGSPYTVDFGDDFDGRVLLIDGKNRVRSVDCPGPQKRLIDVTDLKQLDKVPLLPGDIVKVRVVLEATGDWPALRDAVQAWGEKRGVQVHTVQPVRAQEEKASKRKIERMRTQTDEEILATYGKLRGVDDATLKTGLSLMRKT